MPIKVLIVDDHLVVREGLRMLLRPRYGIQVVGEAVNGDEAVRMAIALLPDVILMDLIMPGKDGIMATAEIIEKNPKAHILILTSSTEDAKIAAAIQSGALGYILKDTSARELLHAIEEVNRGNLTLQASIVQKLAQQMQEPHPPTAGTAPNPVAPDPALLSLTSRELEVTRLVANGMTNRQIANHLYLSDITIRTHVSNVLRKLNLSSRTQLALYAVRAGLVDPDRKQD